MAQVSTVTAARREAAAAVQGGAATTAVALNPAAREFLPWWRLESGATRKPLNADAPAFVMTTAATAANSNAGGSDATTGNVVRARAGRRVSYKPRRVSLWQEAVKRTIFVKYIDHIVTEQVLVALCGTYGTVVDCRICGDPTSSGLRFGFVEFQSEEEAYAALLLNGIIVGMSALKVLPSRTAIWPINPRFLPQSEAEWETYYRTIYCTNISKIVTSSNLKAFCEAYFGKVSRLELLDNDKRSTNLAFIEFAEVDGAVAALSSTGFFAGGLRISLATDSTIQP